jgi:sugar/nucleoside kinase (ribokinase family)
MQMDIVVVGDLNVDLVLTGLPALPAYRELRLAKGMRFVLGGSSAIFACNAARLGAKVGFVGKVGEDEFGGFLRRRLERSGVDTSHLLIDRSGDTGICVSMSFPEEYAMVSYPGVRETFLAEEVDLGYVRTARHLHMSGFYLQRGMQAGAAGLFRGARQAGMSTSLDPDHDPTGKWDGGIWEVLSSVDFFFPNEHEALSIARTPDLHTAANRFRSSGGTTAIKRGADGVLAATAGRTFSTPAFPVTPVDTTGAGDSFNAGFVFRHLAGAPLEECIRWGNACGALSTQALGGTEGFPRPSEVERFLTAA